MTDSALLDELTVIVVTYNSAHCIAGLTPALSKMRHVMVVDNASEDRTADFMAVKLPHAKILRNAKNLGFGAANNRALREVKTRYALLLNPDCLPTLEAFSQLLEAASRHPEAAIIAPHLASKEGKAEISYRWPYSHWNSQGPEANGPCCVGFVCGAVMLLNMEVMRKIGFFDETFFLYYEDEDLCQRAFMAKKPIIVVPDITVTHLSRGSVRGPRRLRAEFYRGYHHVQSKLIFTGKHVNQSAANRLRWRTLMLALAALPLRILIPGPRYVARMMGRIWGLLQYVPPQPATVASKPEQQAAT
jgi:N-acetylglucosaminyl-diphospho-decaprenol L-rhamnosyltransferase